MTHSNGTRSGDHAHEPGRRVVSVSPIDAADASHDATRANGERPISHDIMITPRVLDQTAFNELTGQLRALIDHAHDATGMLREALEHAQSDQSRAARAADNLQDRLRLSARMLKAFQLQIGRIESALEGFESYEKRCKQAIDNLNEQADAVEQRLRSNIQLYEQRIERRVEKAVEAFQHRVAAQVAEVDQIETQLQNMHERSESLQQMLESAEVNVTVLTYKSARIAEQARTTGEETQQIIKQCDDARRALGENLLDASDRIDQLDERASALQSSLSKRVETCRDAERAFDDACERLEHTATRSTTQADQSRAQLESLLERLEPWRAALCDQRVQNLPERLGEAVKDIREDFGADVSTICAALREMAGRLERVNTLSMTCGETDECRAGENVPAETDAADQQNNMSKQAASLPSDSNLRES